MALIQWSDSMSVGVAAMDEQHKKLVALTNDLHAAMLERKAKEVMGRILAGLVDYTAEHFIAEEALMAQHKFPALFQHQKTHQQFVAKAKELQAGYEKGALTISLDTMNFLKQWLVEHIQGLDKEYGKHINK